MRVLMVSWEYPPVIEGGLGRHVRKLCESLASAGVSVHLLTRGDGSLAASEERHGVVVHRVREPDFPWELDAFVRWVEVMNADMRVRARELCERVEFDLVHSHDWLVAAAAGAAARTIGRPWVVTVHATEHGRHHGWVQEHPQSYIHSAERAMLRRADRVIACSRFMRGHVTSVFGVPSRRIGVIPNGIDPCDLEPVAADLQAFRARFAAPDERLVLLVGRLVYEKGFHLALEALAAVIPRLGRVRFVVAGSGMAEPELKRQARDLGLHGAFLGWVGDDMLHSLYRVADLCIVPSIYEPFGLVALEAMASGCPCVVADTGGLREVVPMQQRFRSSDPNALRGAIERALSAPRGEIGGGGVQVPSWTAVARRTIRVYGGVGDNSGTGRESPQTPAVPRARQRSTK
jgi:glycogen synthase